MPGVKQAGATTGCGRGDSGRVTARALAGALLVSAAVFGCEFAPQPLGDRLLEARDRFERVCSGCHPLDVPLRRRKSLAGWRDTVAEMRAKGARLTDREADEVARYLAQTRGR